MNPPQPSLAVTSFFPWGLRRDPARVEISFQLCWHPVLKCKSDFYPKAVPPPNMRAEAGKGLGLQKEVKPAGSSQTRSRSQSVFKSPPLGSV